MKRTVKIKANCSNNEDEVNYENAKQLTEPNKKGN